MKIILFVFVLAACGGSGDASDIAIDPDASVIEIDAALDDAGNPIPPPDAATNPNMLVNVPLSCQPYKWSVFHAATDGSRDDRIESWATVPGIVPGDDYVITKCDTPTPLVCGGGNQCEGPNPPQPTGLVCDVKRGGGTYMGGKLVIHCGTRTERYLSNGALSTVTQTTFTVKLETF